jgi:hypothetical protein
MNRIVQPWGACQLTPRHCTGAGWATVSRHLYHQSRRLASASHHVLDGARAEPVRLVAGSANQNAALFPKGVCVASGRGGSVTGHLARL